MTGGVGGPDNGLYSYTGTKITVTVETSGVYDITAYGAQGGSGVNGGGQKPELDAHRAQERDETEAPGHQRQVQRQDHAGPVRNFPIRARQGDAGGVPVKLGWLAGEAVARQGGQH